MALDSEPVLETDPELAGVQDELIRREPLFHRPEFGTSRADFAAMVADDFWEIGASGRRYSRTYVLDALEQRHRHPHHDKWSATGFHCRQLSPDVFLLTYTLTQGERITRRSTLWQRSAGMWQALFHQGTEAQTGAG